MHENPNQYFDMHAWIDEGHDVMRREAPGLTVSALDGLLRDAYADGYTAGRYKGRNEGMERGRKDGEESAWMEVRSRISGVVSTIDLLALRLCARGDKSKSTIATEREFIHREGGNLKTAINSLRTHTGVQ